VRCPDCNKFVGNEQGDPELDLQVDLDRDEKGQPGAAQISGNVRLILLCADCNTELAESQRDIETEVSMEHKEAESHDATLEDEAAESTDRFDGKPGTPARYRRHYYGAEISGKVSCSCGATAEFSAVVEEQAGGFDSLS